MAFQNIAVAGATGNLGPTVVKNLVDAGFTVTTLSRTGKKDNFPSSVKTAVVDYESQQSLVDALKGQDAVVCTISEHGMQPQLIDAAIAAGVKHFIPSEFGADLAGNAKAAGLPVFAGKVKTQEYLKSVQDKIGYTVVVNGTFLDWCIGYGFSINMNDVTQVMDGGNEKHSMTTLDDVGKAVVAILKNAEQFKNRVIYIQSTVISQNELIAIAEKKGKTIKTQDYNSAEVEKTAWDLYNEKGFAAGTDMTLAFISLTSFCSEYGSNWNDKKNNDEVGIKEKTPEEIEQIVAQYV